jgi:uncharacterized protein GlcG (DUF336 family)
LKQHIADQKGIEMSSITLKDAQIAIAGALAKAKELGYNVAVAVVDVETSVVASVRMDGTNPFTPDVVRGKAVATVISRGTPSGIAASRFPDGLKDHVTSLYGGRVTWVQGAVPIKRGDELLGAIGVGGGPPDQDEIMAQAGADALV